MSILANVLTEGDNKTHCPVRLGTSISAALYHVAAVVGAYMGSIHIDIATLGQYLQHMSLLFGVTGLAVGAKAIMGADAKPDA